MFEFEKKRYIKKSKQFKNLKAPHSTCTQKKTSPLLKRITKEELIKNLNDSRFSFGER